jgi:hypothetical protein
MRGKRWCWNWQTGMVEGHVPKGVEVQVLSSAPKTGKIPGFDGDFCFGVLDPKGLYPK